MNKTLFLRVKTILSAKTLVSLITVVYILSKRFSPYKITMNYLLSLFFDVIISVYTDTLNTMF